jgi:Rha family phage regulatory protein
MTNLALVSNPESFIFAQGEELKTTSLKIAEAFGKLHKHVLRDIEQIISQTIDIPNAPKFGLIEIDAKVGFGTRKDKAYEMNQDGLVLVVMGYTGIDAMAIKVRYINAFNFMRAKLFPKRNALVDLSPAYLTPAMKKHINRQVSFLAKTQIGTTHSALGKSIQDKFNVNKREFILASKYSEVCEFLGCEPDAKALQGELVETPKLEYQPPEGMMLVAVEDFEKLKNSKHPATSLTYHEWIDVMNQMEAGSFRVVKKDLLLELKKMLDKII